MCVANLERHLIPSPFLRINFLQSSSGTASSSSEDSYVESDSDHDVVMAHYSSSDLSESDASDAAENNHLGESFVTSLFTFCFISICALVSY